MSSQRSIGIVLFPLSLLYRMIAAVRNFLFDKRLIKIDSFPVPVISVGNLTTGGTGKTPLILYLLEILSASYEKPAVVTRGYGRKSKGCVIVSDGRGNHTDAVTGGDEPLLIGRRMQNVVVIASEKRSAGIRKAIAEFHCDIILLDDAFQHRFVKRNCDIVLVNAGEGKKNVRLLPWGRLREPLKNIRRADIVLISKGDENLRNETETLLRSYFKGPVFYMQFDAGNLVLPDFKNTLPVSDLIRKRVAAFCGIAHPDDFLKTLKSFDLDLCWFSSYPDHFNYTEKDVYRIIRAMQDKKCETAVTTEKDLVRLPAGLFRDIELVALRIGVSVSAKFTENVRSFIDNTVSYR